MRVTRPATSEEAEGRVIPDFAADERARAQYAQSLERRIKAYYSEQDAAIRHAFRAKRESLAAEIAAGASVVAERNAAAKKAVAAYRLAYPHRFPATRATRPALFEVVLSCGAAARLFNAIAVAHAGLSDAQNAYRRLHLRDEELAADVNAALAQAVEKSRQMTASPAWLEQLHRDATLGAMKARVDAIERERSAYAQRLAAGRVPDDEMRDRAFAELDVHPIVIPLTGMIFYRVERYGDLSYFIVRDLERRFYALPYDPRLEAVADGVFDVVRTGDRFDVRAHVRAETGLPFTPLDHFVACNDGNELIARGAYRDQQARMKQPRSYAATRPATDAEYDLLALLIAFSATIAAPRDPLVN